MPQVPVNDQFYLGRGMNSATGKVFGNAIDYDPPQPYTTGQTKILRLQSITSTHELLERISISASASLNMGNWGGSAGVNLAKEREINNYYTYALINVVVKNPSVVIRNPRLKLEAKEKLINEGWDAFASAYGLEYLEGYITGGTYYALIEFKTKSELQQNDLKVKLSGFYGPFSASAELSATLKETSKSVAMNVLVSQSGGIDAFEITLDEMLQQAINFPEIASKNPVPIVALVSEYKDTVPLPSIPSPNSLAQLQQKNTLEDLGSRYLKLRDYKAAVQFVLDNFIEFDDFRNLSTDELAVKKNEFRNSLEAAALEMQSIVNSANKCTEDLSQCGSYIQTTNLTILPLPTIGGQLMSLKQLEERLNAMQQELAQVSSTANNAIQGKLQKVDTGGDITFGTVITSTGRMHVNGEEILYLLNKNGVIVSKAWGGSGNLTVDGEIYGKLWFSQEYNLVVPKNGQVAGVKMLPANKCFAFITAVGGAFSGGGERVWVEIRGDGYWYLCGQSLQNDVSVQARCVGTPPV